MAPRRILLINRAGTYRDALARALSREGHEVEVSAPGEAASRAADLQPDAVVGSEEHLEAVRQTGAELVTLRPPVNMEELRRALREG